MSENADLTGGGIWSALLQDFPTLPGGIAEAFVRDPRLARTYAGLANMPPETATALVTRMGLRALVTGHSEAVWRYGDTFRSSGDTADAIWEKLARVSPRNPAAFFEALLKTDRGQLAGFYAAVSRMDPDHRKFLLKDAATAQRVYAWYREAEGTRGPLLQQLPLDDSGWVRFPGGRQAWWSGPASADDEILWPPLVNLAAVIAVSRLERDRAAPLDAETSKLLARNVEEWRALFPYFAALPRLGSPEFQALDSFAAAARVNNAREALMREWHSLAAFLVLARKAGSLNDEAAARAFGRMCRELAAPDHSAKAIAFLRDIAGQGVDLDKAVVGMLRLSGPARAAFDGVREWQSAPRLGAVASVGAALSGIVYGAMLDPGALLVQEDRELLRKHQFAPAGALFSSAELKRLSTAPGSHFIGGFMNFDEVARRLAHAGGSLVAKGNAEPDASDVTFRASARLVEVYATVTNPRGRLVDGLRRDQFSILDGGRAAGISAFENGTTAISCALLLDTSGSMDAVTPAMKSAALKLIGGLRTEDSVAIYSLTGGLSQLQPFTQDKTLAARVMLRAEPGEYTALYDGLVRVNRDLAARTGKKAIIVFTDGEDNDSALSAETAIQRAKTAGVPIYTIALGHANFLRDLSGMAQATGGLSFQIQSASQIAPVFDNVLQDLLHGYLLAFQPRSVEDRSWRKIEVRLPTPANVRARQGYYPE